MLKLQDWSLISRVLSSEAKKFFSKISRGVCIAPFGFEVLGF
jgi:hypothetical protein